MYEIHYLTHPDDDIKVCFLYNPESYEILNVLVYYHDKLQCVYDTLEFSNTTVIDPKYHTNVPSEYHMSIQCTITNYKLINRLDTIERTKQFFNILKNQTEFINKLHPNGFNVPELNLP